jgi:CubicO group peptidase (beta-lactamase class C family)
MPSKTSMVRLTVALAVLAGSIAAAASPASDATIARRVQTLLERSVRADGPGVAVLVAKGDRVIVRTARGQARIDPAVPLSADHELRIASITKTFTAAAILTLAEAGKLSLDDTLATHLPEVTDARRVTIRQLLTHSGGIAEGSSKRPAGVSRVAAIGGRPLAFEPGTKWSYSNSGYILLGAVIEKVSGRPWHQMMAERFFQPLGLMHTRYGVPAEPITGYSTDSRTKVTATAEVLDPGVPDAAGGLVSTADDLLRWMCALATGRAIGGGAFARMIAPSLVPADGPTRDRYGFGVYVWQVRGETMIGHTGQIPGFAAVLAYLPASDVTVIALGNDDEFDARQTGRRLAAIAIGNPYPDVVPVVPSADALQSLVGTYGAEPGTVRTLSVRDGRLHAQRGTGNVLPLQMTADGRLHFDPDGLSYFVPARDASGRVVRLDYFPDGEAPAQPLPRVVTGASQSR